MNDIVLQVAMKAVIVKDDKILILREAATYGEGTQHGRYHMPGGRMHAGESFEDTLRREVREETGLEIDIKYPIYIGEWRPVIKDVPYQIVAMFQVCFPKTSKITLSLEHDDFKWIKPNERGKFDIMDPEDKVIDRFAEWQNQK